MKKYLIALIALSVIFPAIVHAQTWQQVKKRTQAQKTVGLAGGEGWQAIYGIAYAASNPNTIYIITDTNQIWKSTDGGATWARKSNGFYANGGLSIAVDPTNENIVYAAGSVMGTWADLPGAAEGIFRTSDGGTTWTLVQACNFDRNARGGTHFAFQGSTIYAGSSGGGLRKSTNGTTWTILPKNGGGNTLDGVGYITDIQKHPTDSTVIYGLAGGTLYKVVDVNGSSTVTAIGTGLPTTAVQLQIDSTTVNNMYAACITNGVYKSTNAGLNFSASNSGMSVPNGQLINISLSPSTPTKLLCAWGYPFFGKATYYSNNSAATWTLATSMDEQNADGMVAGSVIGWTTNIMSQSGTVPTIQFHPSNSSIALISGFYEFIEKTTDGGLTWKYSNSGYTGSVAGNLGGKSPIGWDSLNANRAIFAHADFGPLITNDNEDTFTNIANTSYLGSYASHAAAMQGSIIVEAIGQYNGTQIFVSRNSGASFTAVAGTTQANDIYLIKWHGTDTNVVYAGPYRFDSIQTNNNFTSIGRPVWGIFHGNGNIIYSQNSASVSKSTDKGATWSNPYPSLNIPAGYYIDSMAVDPTNQNRIYVAVSGQGVYIITDTVANGGTVLLKGAASGLSANQFGNVFINSVETDPNNAGVVYASSSQASIGHSNGIFRSIDSGLTWTNINGNLGSAINVYSFIVNPFNSYIYCGTFGGSWKLPPPSAVASQWTLHSVDSQETTYGNSNLAVNAFDSNVNTMWHTKWVGGNDPQPHNIQINLGQPYNIGGFRYLPRQDGGTNGRIGQYEFYVSTDGSSWGSPVGSGTFANDATEKTVTFGTQTAKQYIQLKSITEATGNPWTSAAEISLITGDAGTNPTGPPSAITLATSNIAQTTAQVNGQVNPNGIQSTYRWQYGTAPATYTLATGSQTVATNTVFVNVNNNLTSLNPGTSYYTRLQANNGSGTTNGSETSFATIAQTTNVATAIQTGTTTVTIDGLLGDWPTLTNSINTLVSGTITFTGSWSAMWLPGTGGGVYIATQINDGTHTMDSGNNIWDDDSVDFYFDFDFKKGSGYDTFDRHVLSPYGSSTTIIINAGGTTTGIVISGSNTPTSYTKEIFVPSKNFVTPSGTPTLSAQSKIGFDIGINNDDNGGLVDSVKQWNNPVATNYFDTRFFGEILLLGTTTDLLTWYPMDDFEGTATDVIGNKNSALISGATWTANGIINRSLSLDGIDDHAFATNTSFNLNGTNTVSVSLWLKPLLVGNPAFAISKKITDSWSTFYIQQIANGAIQFGCENQSLGQFPTWRTGTNTVGTNTVIHVAASFQKNAINASDGTIWINGQGTSTLFSANGYTAGFSLQEVANIFTIGANNTFGYVCGGLIDDIRIYSTKLSTATVNALYAMRNDSVAPLGTVTINSNATYTSSLGVTLTLTGTDSAGVTGYFPSEGSTTPYATQTGWISIATTTVYSSDVPFTLTPTDGTKNVYVWFKDMANNIGTLTTDSIILDTTFPTNTILTPASTYRYNVYGTTTKAYGTTGTSIAITGSSTDLNDVKQVRWTNSATTTTGLAVGTTTYSLTLNLVPNQLNILTTIGTDSANNSGSDTLALGAFPTVDTYSADSITISSGKLYGTVAANNNTTSAYFQIGTISGYYTGTSSLTQVTGTIPTQVSWLSSGLLPGTISYYRAVGSNTVGIIYGQELSFVTLSPSTTISTNGMFTTFDDFFSTNFLIFLKQYNIYYSFFKNIRSTQDYLNLLASPDAVLSSLPLD
jgi:hypothetical protein